MSKVFVSVVVFFTLLFTSHFASADEPPKLKSRGTAFALSASGTALSIGVTLAGYESNNPTLITAGLLSSLVTPAAGEIYAGKLLTWGMGIRLASAGMVYGGFVQCFNSEVHPCGLESGLGLMGLGVVGYAGGVIYDIATAGTAVDDYNKKFRLQLTPIVAPTTSGPAVGLGIAGSF